MLGCAVAVSGDAAKTAASTTRKTRVLENDRIRLMIDTSLCYLRSRHCKQTTASRRRCFERKKEVPGRVYAARSLLDFRARGDSVPVTVVVNGQNFCEHAGDH